MNGENKTSIFTHKAKLKHGNRYTYTNIEYKNAKTKIQITCHTHGMFSQTPSDHLAGYGCPDCGGSKKLTTQKFIEKSIDIHGDAFDYTNAIYVNNKTPVEVKCNRCHTSYAKNAKSHLKGYGCRVCSVKRSCSNNNTDQFRDSATKIHGDRYSYENTLYIKSNEKVVIGCNIHGHFHQTPNNHLNGQGCPACAEHARVLAKTKSYDLFVKQAREVHGELYEYNELSYINRKEKTMIVCTSHGVFMQSPYDHISGRGCWCCGRRKSTLTEIDSMDECEASSPYSLYIVRVCDSDFIFFKVGVTHHKNINLRFPPSRYGEFEIEVIYLERGRKRDILVKELNALLYLESLGVRYNIGGNNIRGRFNGWTECFKDKNIVDDIISESYLV